MLHKDFNIDGSFKRLGFIMLPTSEVISFGYTNMYDIIENCGYEDINESYHNSAITNQLEKNPKLSYLKDMITRDYGKELLYSPFFPTDETLSTLVTTYGISIFKNVNIPSVEPVDLLLLRNGITEKEINKLKQLMRETMIFRRLKLCGVYEENDYIEYNSLEEYIESRKKERRK